MHRQHLDNRENHINQPHSRDPSTTVIDVTSFRNLGAANNYEIEMHIRTVLRNYHFLIKYSF